MSRMFRVGAQAASASESLNDNHRKILEGQFQGDKDRYANSVLSNSDRKQ